jgi:distribution and morphology protein 31
MVPRWRDGTLRLRNVSFVCNAETWREWKRVEYEERIAAERSMHRHADADFEGQKSLLVDGDEHLRHQDETAGQETEHAIAPFDPDALDMNWTYWDLHVETLDISISLWRLMDGKGLIKSAAFKGVRGTCDREHITWAEDWEPIRRTPEDGDFDLESLRIEDMLVNVKNPRFRHYSVSVFRAELPRFRKQWMFYDLMCADSVVGIFDNCLFSLHKPQSNDLAKQNDIESHWSKIVT